VNFFQLDCLASEARFNVDFDVALSVIAHGCSRWLATRLFGCGTSKPKQRVQRMVGTEGDVEIQDERIVVRSDNRARNAMIREAALDPECPPIPWLGGRRLAFQDP
jgi:hypothetical protein